MAAHLSTTKCMAYGDDTVFIGSLKEILPPNEHELQNHSHLPRYVTFDIGGGGGETLYVHPGYDPHRWDPRR